MRLFPVITPKIENLRELNTDLIKEADRCRISLSSFQAIPLFFGSKIANQVITFTFYCEFNHNQMVEITKLTRLRLTHAGIADLYDYALLVFGSLLDWLEAIKMVCKDKMQDRNLRFIFNVINNYFVSLGIKEFQMIDNRDSTYLVRELT